jgi:hypothetical protein
LGLRDRLRHFRIDLGKLDAAVDLVLATTRKAYPTFDVPFHSRWRHFVVGGVDRWAALADARAWRDGKERARAEFDLAIVSVLLDAARGRPGATAIPRPARASAVPKVWRSPASICSRTASFPPALTRRCGPTLRRSND